MFLLIYIISALSVGGYLVYDYMRLRKHGAKTSFDEIFITIACTFCPIVNSLLLLYGIVNYVLYSDKL